MEWCRSQAEFFQKIISATWEHCSVLLPVKGKIFCLRRSLERSAILIMAFIRLHPGQYNRKLCPDRCRYSGMRARQRGRRHESIFHMRRRGGPFVAETAMGEAWNEKNCGRAAESSAQQQADRAVSDRLTLFTAVTASGARRRRISH